METSATFTTVNFPDPPIMITGAEGDIKRHMASRWERKRGPKNTLSHKRRTSTNTRSLTEKYKSI